MQIRDWLLTIAAVAMTVWAATAVWDDPTIIEPEVSTEIALVSADLHTAIDRVVLTTAVNGDVEIFRTDTGTWAAENVTQDDLAQSITIAMGQLLDATIVEPIAIESPLSAYGLAQPAYVVQLYNGAVQVAEFSVGNETATATGYYVLQTSSQTVGISRLPDLTTLIMP